MEPFKFCARLTLTEVTGRMAFNMAGLLEGIREADDAIIYHHTHRFIKQSHFLVPAGSSDFACWGANTGPGRAGAKRFICRDSAKG